MDLNHRMSRRKILRQMRVRKTALLVLFFLGLLIILFGVLKIRHTHGLRDNELKALFVIISGILVSLSGILVWRCPACKFFLSLAFKMQSCPNCGRRIRPSTRSLRRDKQVKDDEVDKES